MLQAAGVLGALARAALWLAGTGLVLMTAMIAWQVFGRFVLNDTPTWTESVSIIVMGWFIFLGAAVGIREGYHLSFDILLYVIPKKAERMLHTVSDIVVITFGCGMVVYGIQLAARTWANTIPNVGIPIGVSYIAIIAGGALMVLFSAERIARRLSGLPTSRFIETDDPAKD
jgi:TRAP-type C4-dicarboxylate transport system permease small subunit